MWANLPGMRISSSTFARKNTSPIPAPPVPTTRCGLTPPTILSLEQSLEFINEDELVEVTPENIRLRKMILSKEQRMKQAAKKK